MLPQTRGAERVYHSALRPIFKQGQAKAKEISQNAPSYNSSTSTNFGASSSPSTTFGTSSTTSHTRNDSLGRSTGVASHPASATSSNPFTGTSAAGGAGSGFDGLHTTSAGSFGKVGGATVPPAAGMPLPEVSGSNNL